MNSDAEVFKFDCPSCGKRLKATRKLIGKRVKCPGCGQSVQVAAPASEPPKSAPESSSAASPQSNALDAFSLAAPAIADLSGREQQAAEVRAEKEAKRQASLAKNKNRASYGKPVQPLATSDLGDEGLIPFDSDDDSPSATSASPIAGAPSVAGNPEGDAPVRRSVFDDDLPELEALSDAVVEPEPISSPRKPRQKKLSSAGSLSELDKLVPGLEETPTTSNGNSHSARVPAGNDSRSDSERPNRGRPDEDHAEAEYRVICTTCGTGQYVSPSAIGKKVKCPDCFSQFAVPAPPKDWNRKGRKGNVRLDEDGDMALAPPAALPEAHTEEAKRGRSQQILEKAVLEVSDEEIEQLYDNEFDTAGFVQNTFGFTKDVVVMSQVLGYGIVFAAVFGVGHICAQIVAEDPDGFVGRGMLLITFILVPIVAMLFAMPMFSGALGLIVSVGNKQKRVLDAPSFNFFDNFGEIMVIAAAVAFSIVPGFFFGASLGSGAYVRLIGMLATCCAFFPIFLLSMLDNNSIVQPISTSVLRSLTSAAEAWGGYYMKTVIGFFVIGVAWLMLLGHSPVLTGLAGCLLPLLVFYTSQQIGSLANSIADNLSFELSTGDSSDDSELTAD